MIDLLKVEEEELSTVGLGWGEGIQCIKADVILLKCSTIQVIRVLGPPAPLVNGRILY